MPRVAWKAFPILFGEIKDMPITDHSVQDRRRASQLEPRAQFVDWDRSRPYVSTSMRALEAAKCANAQGNVPGDEYHNALYRAFFAESRDISDPRVLLQLAADCRLDLDRFTSDFVAGYGRDLVIADYLEAREYWGALTTGVPLVIINGIPLVGAVPESSYDKLLGYAVTTIRNAQRLSKPADSKGIDA